MNTFSVIAGSGHCGTTWLAHVLNSQPGVTWHHHFKEEMYDRPWQVLDTKPPSNRAFNQYWRWIRGEMQHHDVGDANSWPPHMLFDVNIHQPIHRVIYLTRNGVQQLHSLYTRSPVFGRKPLHDTAEMKVRALYEIMPEVPDKPYDQWGRFEKTCLLIAANDFMPEYLRQRGLNVEVYSLDSLIHDPSRRDLPFLTDTLRQLAPGLDDDQLRQWQITDINRKVKGNRQPAYLWNKWKKKKQRAYRMIVGDPEI